MSSLLRYLVFCLLSFSTILYAHSLPYDKDEEMLKYKLYKIPRLKPEQTPTEFFYAKGERIYCTGKSPAAIQNNKAADFMEIGEYEVAKNLLTKAMKHAPIFYPYLFNKGVCCTHLNELREALVYLNKARDILPTFPGIYIQIGFVYQADGKDQLALDSFRMALRVNPKELEAFILIGDIYYIRNQYKIAERYYGATLKIDPRYPNGIIGLAKIHYANRKYLKAINLLKTVDLRRDYDKSLHYYFAECSFKTQDYQSAYDQYTTLLQFKGDKFFITHSTGLIQHKRKLAGKFIGR